MSSGTPPEDNVSRYRRMAMESDKTFRKGVICFCVAVIVLSVLAMGMLLGIIHINERPKQTDTSVVDQAAT